MKKRNPGNIKYKVTKLSSDFIVFPSLEIAKKNMQVVFTFWFTKSKTRNDEFRMI
jgi:hypothetical protein